MVAIYLTGITIAMCNITGIGFVLFMMLFNQSTSQLKRANLKKSNTISDSIGNGVADFAAPNGASTSTTGGTRAAKEPTQSARVAERPAIASVTSADSPGRSNLKKSGDFDNIDDILDDLDLSDFDDLNLDDFN